MKTIVLLAAVGLALPAWAGYSELQRELDGYQPPALYRAPSSAAPAHGESVPSKEFDSQIALLRQAAARWEKSLSEPEPAETFFVPDAGRLEALRKTADDGKAVKTALEKGLALPDLEILALLRNPAVAAKEREVKAVLAGYGQVENLDSVLRRYALLTSSLMTGVGAMESPDALALKFPFPGILALKGQVVGQEAAAAREALEAARRDAVTGVRKAYWEILYLQTAGEITARMVDLLGNLRSAASARYAAGETSFQDVVRMGVETEMTREELVTVVNELHHMQSDIVEILALPPVHHLGTAADSEPSRELPDPQPLYAVAREKRQELRGMRAMVGKMERMLEMAETMIYPGFTLGLSVPERNDAARVGSRGMGEGETGSFPVTTTAAMGEGLPKMPWFGKDEAYLRETRERVEALKKGVVMEEAAVDWGVHAAWFKLDKALREERLYRDRVISLSQTAMEAATRGYSAGKVMFSDVIESYDGWFKASLGAARARADAGIAHAELEAAVGTATLGR